MGGTRSEAQDMNENRVVGGEFGGVYGCAGRVTTLWRSFICIARKGKLRDPRRSLVIIHSWG
jgi:hypothetical protein